MNSLVIGSGPAAVACASALLNRGAFVRMVDAGLTIEPHRAEIIAQLARRGSSTWDMDSLSIIKENMSSGAKGIPLKYSYGSDFPYRGVEEHLQCDFGSTGLRPSLALGGLSNVWGAALLPYAQKDLTDWPLGLDALLPHYAAVEAITGVAGQRDGLEALFPILSNEPTTLRLSKQGTHFLKRLERYRQKLGAAGISFGYSRLAVRGQRKETGGCVYCGLCMYGCPYGYIYNSASTVQELLKNPRFSYQPDWVVDHLQETATGVLVHGHDRNQQTQLFAEADRVYLAAGVIPTTRILLESQKAYDRPVFIQDSQYFLLPLVMRKKSANVHLEQLHTLSQLFMEIDDPAVSPNLVHLQIYSYNDLITGALRQSLGPLGSITPLIRELEGRLLIIQGYIHSRHSGRIRTVLREGNPGLLEMEAEPNPETRTLVKRVVRKLMRQALRLDALPLAPMLQVAPVGRGFHSGGSFPMREQPGPFQCDLQGRPHGFERVHVADATNFPNIPATTITMSAMANAHRIGSL